MSIVRTLQQVDQSRVIDLIPDLDVIRGNTVVTVEAITTASYEVTQFGGSLILFCDCTSNVIDVTLQTAVDNTIVIYIKKIDSTANNLTINTTFGETIDGVQPLVISNENQCIQIISDGINWKIISMDADLSGYQELLISATNIKTINGSSILGSGNLVVSGTGTPFEIVNQTAATYNAIATEGNLIVLCDTTANAITVNLPTAVSNNCIFTVKKVNSGANVVTIDGNGAETIDGGSTAVLNVQYESITLVSNGTNFMII